MNVSGKADSLEQWEMYHLGQGGRLQYSGKRSKVLSGQVNKAWGFKKLQKKQIFFKNGVVDSTMIIIIWVLR